MIGIPILRNDINSGEGSFDRSWTQYQQGFESSIEYWIGLDRLHQLTQGNCQVRFDLQATNSTWYYAQYSTFSVGDSSTNYVLTIGGWSGDTGYDAMAGNNGWPFSTSDADHDAYVGGNCAQIFGGGLWYNGGVCACGYGLATASRRSQFAWVFRSGWISMNVVEVYLLC